MLLIFISFFRDKIGSSLTSPKCYSKWSGQEFFKQYSGKYVRIMDRIRQKHHPISNKIQLEAPALKQSEFFKVISQNRTLCFSNTKSLIIIICLLRSCTRLLNNIIFIKKISRSFLIFQRLKLPVSFQISLIIFKFRVFLLKFYKQAKADWWFMLKFVAQKLKLLW